MINPIVSRSCFFPVLLVGLPTASTRSGLAQDTSAVTDIGSRRELFVDHSLLERLVGTRLQLHHPEPAETVLKLDRPWEGDTGYGLSVIQDGDTYHMYYQGRTRRPVPARRTTTLYARSQDGIHCRPIRLRFVMKDADIYSFRFR